jgi:nitrogen fixation protein FixH
MRNFMILISILVVAITVGTIIAGIRSFDGIVVEKPYEEGLEWDRIQKQKKRLGWTVNVRKDGFRVGRNELSLVVADKAGKPLPDARVSVKVTRPSTASYDRSYRTTLLPGGAYGASIDLPLQGHWSMIITIQQNSQETVFRRDIFADPPDPAPGEPVSCNFGLAPCSGRLANSTIVDFDIQPRPVKAMSALLLGVKLRQNGKPVNNKVIRVDFTMPGMYMARNQPLLKQVAEGRYEGKGVIPRCITGKKTWQAEVMINEGNRSDYARFIFEVN